MVHVLPDESGAITLTHVERLPPVWLMGFANLSFGIYGAVMLVTVPQLLAARGVPEPQIASVTAFALIPGFCGFLLSPMLDVRFSRRTYAALFAVLTAVLSYAALLNIGNLSVLRILLFAAYLSANLFNGALGGWLGSLVSAEQESRLGAWLTVANIGGFGVAAAVAIALLRSLPFAVGAVVLSLVMVVPTLIFIALPAPGPDRRLARESFSEFFRDLLALVKRRSVVRTLLLFALPAASFALTNQLGGLGEIFHASERVVSVVAGIGCVVAGIVGPLLVPQILKRTRPRVLYLMIGGLGAMFTLSLLVLPRTPVIFALAILGENIFQAAAFTTECAIIFGEIGKNNPLAATQFTFLTAATNLPIAYMQMVDGRAYGIGGVTGSFLADAGLSLCACAILTCLVAWWSKTDAVVGQPAPEMG